MRLHVDGEIVGENPLICSVNKDLHEEGLKNICLTCPEENKHKLHGYVHRIRVLFGEPSIKNHYVKVCLSIEISYFLGMGYSFVSETVSPNDAQDPPLYLAIDQSSASEIEEGSDSVWSIVGGKVKSIIAPFIFVHPYMNH